MQQSNSFTPHRLSWQKVASEKIAECKVFTVHRNLSQRWRDEEKKLHNFFVFHPSNWVNIIPVTPENQVVLIEQYRHGIEQVTLEIPGGMVDPEDASSEHAAKRELLEETGFVAEEVVFLGRNHPNPAIQSNVCDTFLAKNVRQIETPTFYGAEEVAVTLVPLERIPSLIKNGMLTHSLGIVAFHLLQLHLSEQ